MRGWKSDLGSFEECLLLAIRGLGDNAYGVTIGDAIAVATGREPSLGAIYTTLERLGRKGYVRSWMGDATPERGGRAKRYYQLEGAGVRALDEAERSRTRLRQGAASCLEPAGAEI